MERIAIVGCPGSGKSTLAARLAERHGLHHVELDALFHGPNWAPVAVPEFRARVNSELEGGTWVADGNYRPVEDIVQGGADTVIWLDFARWRVMSRIIRRSLRRVVTRERLWNGNRESWRNLLSPDPQRNVIVWAWQHHRKYRDLYGARLCDGTWCHATVHHLRRPGEARALTKTD